MNKPFIILVLAAIGIAALMIVKATSQTSKAVFTVAELLEDKEREIPRLRLGGRVANMPINYSHEPKLELKFEIEDAKNPSGTILVTFFGIKPDMFAVGRDVLVDGRFSNGQILASELLTQCPSKYEPPLPGQEDSTKQSHDPLQSYDHRP